MTTDRTVLLVCLAALSTPSLFALPNTDPLEKSATVSSSSALPDAPDATEIAAASRSRIVNNHLRTNLRLGTRPFSSVAVSFTTGLGGLGIDVATPLATKINLRVSGSFLNYNRELTADGLPLLGSLKMRSIGAGVELFPYHNSFHITPGFTIYNANHAGAVTNVAPGATFSVNDTEYMSDPVDPAHGSFDLDLGRRIAPSFTVGWGNMLRRDSHWAIPVDVGFQYVGQPKLVLKLAGSTCDPNGTNCGTIANDPDAMQNLADEQAKLNTDISPLRFYPILKVGLSYRFGRNVKREYWY